MLELSKWGDDDIFRGVFVLTVHLTSHMTWKMASHMCIHKGMQGQDMRTKGSTRPHHHNPLHFNSPFPSYRLLISGCVYLRKDECRFVDLAPPTEQCPESCKLALIGTPPPLPATMNSGQCQSVHFTSQCSPATQSWTSGRQRRSAEDRNLCEMSLISSSLSMSFISSSLQCFWSKYACLI